MSLFDGWGVQVNLIAWTKIILPPSNAKSVFPINTFLFEILHVLLILG